MRDRGGVKDSIIQKHFKIVCKYDVNIISQYHTPCEIQSVVIDASFTVWVMMTVVTMISIVVVEVTLAVVITVTVVLVLAVVLVLLEVVLVDVNVNVFADVMTAFEFVMSDPLERLLC